MARDRKRKKKATTGDAARRRILARVFNDTLTSATAPSRTADKRTQQRLTRYRTELKSGKTLRGRSLTALDVAHRVNELLAHNGRIEELRKLMTPRVVEYNEDVVAGILREMHPVYGYCVHAYRWAGVRDETLVAAGILDKIPTKRGPKPRAEKAGGKDPIPKRKMAATRQGAPRKAT